MLEVRGSEGGPHRDRLSMLVGMSAVTVSAPAKINLALSVGPADEAAGGLHPISTWMVTIDLTDDLHLQRLPPGTLSRYAVFWHADARQRSEIDWPITSDLAVRAHLLLEEYTGRTLPVQMRLEKRVPVGGGLGGGSSDAAAMLRGVNALFELELSDAAMETLAAELGSDVSFFIRGGSAIVSGFGEILDRHDACPDTHGVLVMPDAQCSTGAVYQAVDRLGGATLRHEAVQKLAGDGSHPPQPDATFNDLTRPAISVTPHIETMLTQLTEIAQRPAALSGSGSCMFVLCDDPMHALALAEHAERGMRLPAIAVRTNQETHDFVAYG